MSPNLVIRRIDTLLTMDPSLGAGPLGRIDGAAIAFAGDRVAWVGTDAEAPDAPTVLDGSGHLAMPGLIDAHTHAVWAGERATDFEERLRGVPYAAILERGGGILSTVRQTRAASDEVLIDAATARLSAMLDRGVTTVEVKSGYGLDPHHERRLLAAAIEAGRRADVEVVPTFLGAHTVPAELRHDREAYLRQLIEEQLPAVAGLARFADVYVDRGAFTVDEGRRVLEAARAHGLGLKAHAEQVTPTGAAAMAAALGAVSVEHLEHLDEAGVAALAAAGTVAVLLPGAMLYLKDPPPPVAALRAAGVPMAVATDHNPGTSPVIDLWTCATLATLLMGLTVEEALIGITRDAARALALEDRGTLRPGDRADLVLVPPPPGEPLGPASWVHHLEGPRPALVVRGGRVVRSTAR